MRLVFLGTGGYHPNERRHTASIMLPGQGIVFDAGTSFFRVQALLATKELSVFLSHGHLDHICGLTFVIVPILQKTLQRLHVYGTKRTLDAVKHHLLAEPVFPVDLPETQFIELTEDPVSVADGGQLTHVPLEHPGGSTGFRIDWPDRSLAYITDTTAPGDYLEFVRGVDLLIHECYFQDDMQDWAARTGHSHTSAVAQLAKDAGVTRLFLVHIDPQRADDDPIDIQLAQSIFAETHLAEDRMEIDF
jgi:ribonuclease Z